MKSVLMVVARLAILLVTCGVVFGIGFRAILRPGIQQQNAQQETKLAGLERDVNKGRAAKRALPMFREEVKYLKLEAEERLAASPAGGGISELLSQLRRTTTASGVSLQQHAPSSAAGDESEIAARITVRASKEQMLAFFAALGDDEYPFVADELRLFPVEDTTDVLQADLVVTSPLEESTTSQ